MEGDKQAAEQLAQQSVGEGSSRLVGPYDFRSSAHHRSDGFQGCPPSKDADPSPGSSIGPGCSTTRVGWIVIREMRSRSTNRNTAMQKKR